MPMRRTATRARGATVGTPWERDGRPLLTPDGRRELTQRVEHIRGTRLPGLRPLLVEAERDERLVAEFERLLQEANDLDGLLAESDTLHVDPHDFDGRADIGMRVLVSIADEEAWVRPVHPDEAFLDDERISATSPLATALIGARVGQTIWIAAPGGMQPCEVRAIEPAAGG